MNRSTAREIAIQLCFAGANGKLSADELLDSFFAEEHYASLAAEDELYSEYPDDKQMDYIRRLVKLIDGLREIAAEEPRAEKAEQQAEYAHGGAGGVHRCHDLAGVYLRLAQSQSEARVRALAEIDVVVTAAERRAGQQLRAERRDRLIGAYAVGAVYLPPCAV